MKLLEWYKEKGYTKAYEGVEPLESELGIRVKAYPEEGLYVFNYSQIDSPKMHPIVMECRGLILNEDLEIVCLPFSRFFNSGEALEITSKFNIVNSIVYEKLDGSLCKVYHDGKTWQIGTRGTAFAESENYTGEVFQKLILNAFGSKSLHDFNNSLESSYIPHTWTLIFEYTSPMNRVVTPYKEDCMYLIGARDNPTLADLHSVPDSIVDALKYYGLNVKLPKTFKFDNQDEMKEFVNSLDGLQEGVVALDTTSSIRIKLKADQYVAVHRLRGESLPTPKRILGLVVTNETEEYLAYFPEERERFMPYMESFQKLKSRILEIHNLAKVIDDQKEFALYVKDYVFSSVLFQARKNSEAPIRVLNTQDVSRKVKLMESWMSQ